MSDLIEVCERTVRKSDVTINNTEGLQFVGQIGSFIAWNFMIVNDKVNDIVDIWSLFDLNMKGRRKEDTLCKVPWGFCSWNSTI